MASFSSFFPFLLLLFSLTYGSDWASIELRIELGELSYASSFSSPSEALYACGIQKEEAKNSLVRVDIR